MDKNQIQKISLAFDLSEASIKECLKKFAVPRQAKKVASLILKEEPMQKHNSPKMEKCFYFLEEDYILLMQQIDKVTIEIKRVGSEIGDSVSDSHTFHDNFEYEELGRQQKMWTNRLHSLKKFKENVKIIEVKPSLETIGIGSEVKIEAKDGKILTKKIGSYMTFSNDHLSYNSPLAKMLIGKKVGDKIHVKIANEFNDFTIKKVL